MSRQFKWINWHTINKQLGLCEGGSLAQIHENGVSKADFLNSKMAKYSWYSHISSWWCVCVCVYPHMMRFFLARVSLKPCHMRLAQQIHNAIMTSLLRQNDYYVKMMSFWRNNNVIITSCVQMEHTIAELTETLLSHLAWVTILDCI